MLGRKEIGGRYKNTQNFITATASRRKSTVLFTPLAP